MKRGHLQHLVVAVALVAMGLFTSCAESGGGDPVDLGFDANACRPTTCSAISAECGQQPDGCGGLLACGGCSGANFCGGAGANHCGPTMCVPATCVSLGACGTISDGCGNILECGGCTNGTVCGKTMPNRCGGAENADADKDGTSPMQGDCDDHNANVGPRAIEIPNNSIDDNCNGTVDESIPSCDDALGNMHDAASLAAAMGLCDSHFLVSATLTAASPKSAAVLGSYGTLFGAKEGSKLAALSNGVAASVNDPDYVVPQPGTDLAKTAAAPDTTLPATPGCSQSAPTMVNDLSVLELRLRVPQNAHSFKFAFSYFSAEYPEYLCAAYADAFVVMMQSAKEFPTAKNIAKYMNQGITVNTPLLTVCDYGSTPRAMMCTRPGSDLENSGYDVTVGSDRVGGATGWVTATAPASPGEDVVLRFSIYDGGDHILDSAVILDQFTWSTETVSAPSISP